MTVVPLHRDRAATIGGSDIAAAAGIDPHRSRVMLWLEKTGRFTRPETEAMRWGKLLEPVVFEALREDGYDVNRMPDLGFVPNKTMGGAVIDPEREWLTGHVDGIVTFEDGASGIVEVKTTNGWSHRAAEGIPLQHVAQVQQYLHLTGLDRALLAVLVNGQHLETHPIVRNDAAIALLLEAAERMHWHVVTDTQPTVGATDSDREALAALYPSATAERLVRLDRDGMRDVAELRARKEQEKAIGEQVQAIENRLKARMGDAEIAISPADTEVLRWTNRPDTRIDVKRLRADSPAIAEQYSTTKMTRRFSLA